jgi:hypothetical protein
MLKDKSTAKKHYVFKYWEILYIIFQQFETKIIV